MPCSSSCSPRTTGGSTSRCRLAGTGSSACAPWCRASRLWRYLEAPQTKWLVALALATLIGTWTIPTYIIWAGPLWLLLLLTVREARVARFGAGAFGAIAVVYLPVASQVRREMAGYAKEWGRHYTGLDNICATFKSFLFHPQVFFGHSFSNLAVVLIVVSVVLGAQFLAIPNELRRLTLILIGATIVFFVIAIRLGTIVPRTTAFVMIPFAFAMVITVTAVLSKVPSGTFRPAVAVAVGLALSIHSIQVADDLHFVPIANWRDGDLHRSHLPGRDVDRRPARCERVAHRLPGLELSRGLWEQPVQPGPWLVGSRRRQPAGTSCIRHAGRRPGLLRDTCPPTSWRLPSRVRSPAGRGEASTACSSTARLNRLAPSPITVPTPATPARGGPSGRASFVSIRSRVWSAGP